MVKIQSIEPDIADLVNGWLKNYGLDYKLNRLVFKCRNRQSSR